MTWEPEFGEGPQRTPPPASAPPGETMTQAEMEAELATHGRTCKCGHKLACENREEWLKVQLRALEPPPSPGLAEGREDSLLTEVREALAKREAAKVALKDKALRGVAYRAAIEDFEIALFDAPAWLAALLERVARAEQERDEARQRGLDPACSLCETGICSAHQPTEMEWRLMQRLAGAEQRGREQEYERGFKDGYGATIDLAQKEAHARGRAEGREEVKEEVAKLVERIGMDHLAGAIRALRAGEEGTP